MPRRPRKHRWAKPTNAKSIKYPHVFFHLVQYCSVLLNETSRSPKEVYCLPYCCADFMGTLLCHYPHYWWKRKKGVKLSCTAYQGGSEACTRRITSRDNYNRQFFAKRTLTWLAASTGATHNVSRQRQRSVEKVVRQCFYRIPEGSRLIVEPGRVPGLAYTPRFCLRLSAQVSPNCIRAACRGVLTFCLSSSRALAVFVIRNVE